MPDTHALAVGCDGDGKEDELLLTVCCGVEVAATDIEYCGVGVALGAPEPLAAAAVMEGAGAAVTLGAAESLLLLLSEGCGEGEVDDGGDAVRVGAGDAEGGMDVVADPVNRGVAELLRVAAGEDEAEGDSVSVRVVATDPLASAPVAVGWLSVIVGVGPEE